MPSIATFMAKISAAANRRHPLQDLKKPAAGQPLTLTLAELRNRQVKLWNPPNCNACRPLASWPGRVRYKTCPGAVYCHRWGIYVKLRLGLAPLLGRLSPPTEIVSALGPGKGFTLLSPNITPSVRELPIILPGEQMLSWSREGFTIIPLFNPPSRFPALLNEKYWEALSLQLQEILQGGNIAMGPVAFPAASFNYPSPQSTTGEIFRNERLSLAWSNLPRKRLKGVGCRPRLSCFKDAPDRY